MVTLSKFQTAFMKFEMALAFPFIKWLLQSFEARDEKILRILS